MKLDIATIFFLLLMINGTLGAIFFSAWLKRPSEVYLRAAAATLCITTGLALLLARGAIPDRLSTDVANALMLFGLGLLWSAARRFEGRRAPAPLVLAGGAVWLVACTLPSFSTALAARMALASGIAAAYSLAGGYEFLRGRQEVLSARRALAVACFAQGTFLLGRGVYALFVEAPTNLFHATPTQSLILAEPVVMIVVIAVLGVALVREEAETHLRRSADIDALTGVLNRGAFFARAEELIRLAGRDGRPVALLLFDLDHFKSINDRSGHLMGDLALNAFTRAVTNVVRATDLVGRIGGEEFAVLIGGIEASTATAIAERIRFDFARTSVTHDGKALTATVSAGIATTRGATVELTHLIAEADRALYAAKRAGRDQVHGALALAS
jgi:diguanylate cyclase (GGDEF)-like protein